MFKLTRFATSEPDMLADRHHWPIRVDAVLSGGTTPAKVFVIHQQPAGGLVGNFFSCVASVQQMEDLPEDEPEPGVPFFRVASVTQVCRTPEAAGEFWEAVKSAVQNLADNLAAVDQLSVAEEVTISPQ